ncbi:MAG TPA: zinc ribbon domain-containing protein [Patescibacteria group bacterium]|nr:zinc ribbon domain-containing protein [Patescibacteria group bacterium]
MPVYEYECIKCGLQFEHLVRSAQERVTCPGCCAADIRKRISNFAFKSKDSRGNITAASSSGCSGCVSHNCATCSH